MPLAALGFTLPPRYQMCIRDSYKPDVVVCIRDDLSILNSDGNGPDCFW